MCVTDGDYQAHQNRFEPSELGALPLHDFTQRGHDGEVARAQEVRERELTDRAATGDRGQPFI